MNDIELIDELLKRADEEWNKQAKEFAIDEIKKLKEEVHDVISTLFLDEEDIYAILNAIDEHIAELEGKNNE